MHPVPDEQEPHEVGRARRLDLRPQPVQGVAVDPGEERSLAPLLGLDPGAEPAAEHEPLRLQCHQRQLDLAARDREVVRQRPRRRGADQLQAPADQLPQAGRPIPVHVPPSLGCLERWIGRGPGEDRIELRQPFSGDPEDARSVVIRPQPPGPAVRRQRLQEIGQVQIAERPGRRLGLRQEAVGHQGVVQLVRIPDRRPRLVPDPRDRGGVQRSVIGGRRGVQRPPGVDRVGPPLLQGHIVQERIGPRRQHLVRQRRRLCRVPAHALDRAVGHPPQQRFQPVDVHRLDQTVLDRLIDQRVVRDLPVAHDVLQAGDLIRENRGQQVVRLDPLQRRRHLLAAPAPEDRERPGRVPAPARREHGRIEQRLDQQIPGGLRLQVAEDLLQRERVGGAQRQHDRVLGRRGLQLEVEAPAEPFPERQPPGAVDPTAERGVDDQLHAARLVEEAFQHHTLQRRENAQRTLRGGQVLDQLPRARGRDRRHGSRLPVPRRGEPHLVHQPTRRGLRIVQAALQVGPQLGDRPGQLRRAARRLAEPERDRRRLAPGVLHAQPTRLDPHDPPRQVTQLEDVAR